MEKLIYTDQKISKNHKQIIKEICISLILGCTSVLTVVNTFGIQFSLSDWNQGGFLSGLGCLWNRIAYKLLLEEGIVLKEVSGASAHCELFLLMMIVLFAFFSFLILKSGNRYLLLIPAVTAFGPALILALQPELVYIGMCLFALLSGYIEMTCDQGIGRWQAGFVLALMVIMLFVSGNTVTNGAFEKPEFVEEWDNQIEAWADNLYYGENLLANGRISGEKRVTEGDETALSVSMTTPDSLYLRGFVGELYQDGQWELLPYGAYEETKDLFYWLRQGNFNGVGQIGQVNSILQDDLQSNTITVEVKNADKRSAYIPYEISNFDENARLWYESYFTAGKTGKMKSYTYTAAENAVKTWTDITGKFFTREKSESINTYLELESYYNTFVYGYYTHLSDDDRECLAKEIGKSGDQSKGHIEYKTAIKKVMDYLDEEILYTENPALQPNEGENVLETFFRQHKGYDTHYATAATLMFRYYGIPARYVEGYLITPEDVKGLDTETTIEVPRNRIHAWTEIYVDGIGFVPIETCPEYKGVMEEADLNIGLENESVRRDFDQENEKTNALESLQKTKDAKEIHPMVIMVLCIVFAVLLFILVLWLLYQGVKRVITAWKRHRLFHQAPCKVAICYIYKYMEELHLPINEKIALLGNKAAYSNCDMTEEDRIQMLNYLTVLKKERCKREK